LNASDGVNFCEPLRDRDNFKKWVQK
jgi:hypothetical protein